MPRGVLSATNLRKPAITFSGSWSGTRRKLTFAVAFAGITVFAPAPVNPPAMPWTSSVGRDQTRSSTVRPGSPVNCGRSDFFGEKVAAR